MLEAMKKTITLAALAALCLSAAQAADPPPLQEGLWEVRGRSVENPGGKASDFSYRLCRNRAFDAAMDAQVKNAKECTTSFDDLGGGRFAAASSCSLGGRTIVSKGTYTYDSAVSTHQESHATYTPPFQGKTEETLTQEQHFVGPCPAGMNPGDRIMANGVLQRYAP
jgi:opacity protein-like surface antigen